MLKFRDQEQQARAARACLLVAGRSDLWSADGWTESQARRLLADPSLTAQERAAVGFAASFWFNDSEWAATCDIATLDQSLVDLVKRLIVQASLAGWGVPDPGLPASGVEPRLDEIDLLCQDAERKAQEPRELGNRPT